MKTIRIHRFGPVTAYELGYSPIGRPLMTVCAFRVGDVLIDTAQAHMQQALLEHIEPAPPALVLLTHHHEDHSGNASAVSKRFGIPVYGHALTARKLEKPFRILPYQHWVWGKSAPVSVQALPEEPIAIETGTHRLLPIHTPGHSKDHTVYLDRENGALFSGDLFLGERIKYFRADENMRDQIASLEKVLTFDFDALYCCHRPTPTGGKEKLRRKLAFLQEFYDTVRRMHREGLDPKEIVRRLDRKAERLVRWVTMGNACFANMVYSALRDGPR